MQRGLCEFTSLTCKGSVRIQQIFTTGLCTHSQGPAFGGRCRSKSSCRVITPISDKPHEANRPDGLGVSGWRSSGHDGGPSYRGGLEYEECLWRPGRGTASAKALRPEGLRTSKTSKGGDPNGRRWHQPGRSREDIGNPAAPSQCPVCLRPGKKKVHLYIRLRILSVDIFRYKIIL